jgi:dihydroorotate dehydrogenase
MADLWQIPNQFIVGCPFGNYVGGLGMTSTLGTFTAKHRGGMAYRLWRCVRTLRPYPRLRAWTNRLGLPNPGIDSLYVGGMLSHLRGKIISLGAWNETDWGILLRWLRTRLLKLETKTSLIPFALELNPSCPNHGERDETNYQAVFADAKSFIDCGIPVFVKLPPVGYEHLLTPAAEVGLTGVHCCNTLPTPAGGMSGKPLQPLSLAAVKRVKQIAPHLRVIGGGGITTMDDVKRFRDAGADYFATASGWLNPMNWMRYRRMAFELALERKLVLA